MPKYNHLLDVAWAEFVPDESDGLICADFREVNTGVVKWHVPCQNLGKVSVMLRVESKDGAPPTTQTKAVDEPCAEEEPDVFLQRWEQVRAEAVEQATERHRWWRSRQVL